MNSTVYQIVDRVQIVRWDNALQKAVEGWEVRARWAATATILTVFVPTAYYTPENVDAAIRDAGERDERIGALGSA